MRLKYSNIEQSLHKQVTCFFFGWFFFGLQLTAVTEWQIPVGHLSQHTLPPHPPGGGGGGGGLRRGIPPPANLVAHPQLVREAHFPEMECRAQCHFP